MNTVRITEFDWMEEMHKEVVKSLTTTFGLDFLLFDDKKGGDVDTVHNVRSFQAGDKDINISKEHKDNYENRGDYKPLNGNGKRVNRYHTDKKYKQKGAVDNNLHDQGILKDKYRNKKMKLNEGRQLDHTISASEIHHDAGRVLANLDGVSLANTGTNLNSTHAYINALKSDHTIEHFVDIVVPRSIEIKKLEIAKNKNKIKTMPSSTPEQRHEVRKLKDKIRKDQEHLDTIQKIDKEGMRQADKKARSNYNKKIDYEYYSSSKFLKNTAGASLVSGYKMGARQSIGIVLAEVWFELKESIPVVLDKVKINFKLDIFIEEIKIVLNNIFSRVSNKFKNILSSFGDSFLSGIFSSITTTVLNIFFTTQKLIGRLIRETWNSLVGALKLIFFNPQKLTTGQLIKEVVRILSAGAAAFVGIIINQQLAQFFTFPFGTEIAAFISALVTGVIIIGLTYFLDHSEMMQKIWRFLDGFKSKSLINLEYFKKVNAELDKYLLELASLEFNLKPQEIAEFSSGVRMASDQVQINIILSGEVKRRNIDLPYEIGNTDSTRAWLTSLQKK